MKLKITTLLCAVLAASTNVALAEVVVIVNPANKNATLDVDDVKRIFLGKTKSYPGGEAAAPVDQVEGSASRESFYSMFVGKTEAQLKAYWSQLIFSGKGTPPKVVGKDQDVKDWVAKNAGAIAYVDRSVVDGSVKIIAKAK